MFLFIFFLFLFLFFLTSSLSSLPSFLLYFLLSCFLFSFFFSVFSSSFPLFLSASARYHKPTNQDQARHASEKLRGISLEVALHLPQCQQGRWRMRKCAQTSEFFVTYLHQLNNLAPFFLVPLPIWSYIWRTCLPVPSLHRYIPVHTIVSFYIRPGFTRHTDLHGQKFGPTESKLGENIPGD